MPSEAQLLSALITGIYDAALDHTLWPATLEQICAFVHGPGAMIFAQDGALKTGHRFYSWGDDPEYTRLYFERYAALSPVLGYDKCARIAHTAFVDGSTLRQACLKLGYLSGEEFDKQVVPARMTHP